MCAVLAIGVAASPAYGERKKNPFIFSPDNYFVETHYEVGYQHFSELSFGDGVGRGGGLHLTEHNGLVARLPYLVVFLFAAFQAGGDVRLKGSYSETPTETYVDVKNSRGQVVDQQKIVGTSRSISASVVPLTEEEKRLRDEQLERIGAQLAVLALIPTHFELWYMPNRDDGSLHGVRPSIHPLAIGLGRRFQIALGYAGARIKADYMDEETGVTHRLKYRLRSVAGRIGFAAARFLVVAAEYQPNLLDDYGATLRGTATVSIPKLDRVYGKVGAERLGSSNWSTFFEAGLRF